MIYETNWLQWPVKRYTRSFRAYVVEPSKYAPETHRDIFDAALVSLIVDQSAELDSVVAPPAANRPRNFDLIIFPEAFLAANDLITTLKSLATIDEFGCVHVGLRPSSTNDNHLFNVPDIKALVEELKIVPSIQLSDLEHFSNWLSKQQPRDIFNLGCLFTIDANKTIRVCMHPKLVRSKYELSTVHGRHMTEANLLSLVTLVPTNKRFMTVTLQPMICSDALMLPTDNASGGPLEALINSSHSFHDSPPDHIDIVSLSVCTPLQEIKRKNGEVNRQWHSQFRNSFVHAATHDSCMRHHFSTFVLSNFSSIPKENIAGMSGAFIPVPLREEPYPPFVSFSTFGPTEPLNDDTWNEVSSTIDGKESAKDSVRPNEIKRTKGYLACLDTASMKEKIRASMLGFTVSRLLRDNPRWSSPAGLVEFELRTMTYGAGSDEPVFKVEN